MNFEPYPDQWSFLSSIKRAGADEVSQIVQEAARNRSVGGVRSSFFEESEDEPWTLPPSSTRPLKLVEGQLPESVRLVQNNLIYIEKRGLPPAMLNHLIRLAAFQNPEFYKAQAMRLPTFGKPRVISCVEDFDHYIGLPRGCLVEVLETLNSHRIRVELADERFPGIGDLSWPVAQGNRPHRWRQNQAYRCG